MIDEMIEMCVDNFVPAIRAATEDVTITEEERTSLFKHFFGTIAKLLFSFVWQVGDVELQ